MRELLMYKAEVKEAETDIGKEAPASMVMSFGSGDISTQVASDQVQIGAVTSSAEGMASLFFAVFGFYIFYDFL